ncbi:hypothetical protein B0H16DRAFT_1459768 [Mycena metata]|uniref:Uncharacterized protein n=1 Tax=Mycena metata TaxID=1033252 RepID=A0AAD7NAH2_9AGAR|nr:hypothetical protein B0H16DRAFT_1459768 [Mycena metata]
MGTMRSPQHLSHHSTTETEGPRQSYVFHVSNHLCGVIEIEKGRPSIARPPTTQEDGVQAEGPCTAQHHTPRQSVIAGAEEALHCLTREYMSKSRRRYPPPQTMQISETGSFARRNDSRGSTSADKRRAVRPPTNDERGEKRGTPEYILFAAASIDYNPLLRTESFAMRTPRCEIDTKADGGASTTAVCTARGGRHGKKVRSAGVQMSATSRPESVGEGATRTHGEVSESPRQPRYASTKTPKRKRRRIRKKKSNRGTTARARSVQRYPPGA